MLRRLAFAPLWLSFAFPACGGDPADEAAAAPPTAGEDDPEEGLPDASSASAEGGAPIPEHGLRSDWFDVFAEKKATRYDLLASIAHDETKAPADGIRGILYSARFTGTLDVPAAGEVTFFVKSDDGVRLFVDDEPVVDLWTAHSPTDSQGKATLTAGAHELRIEYFQLRGSAVLEVEWQLPGAAREPIPKERLTPAKTAPEDGPRPSFENPVVPFDCPDPGVSAVPGDHPLFVMVCTGGRMPIRVSDDLVGWRDSKGAILPAGKAPWSANGGRNWAPEIHRVGGDWVAYFTAVNGANKLSIGCAYASAPTGPYTDCGGPLVEHPQGVIDATFFEDDGGKRYLYYKIDGNSVGQPTPIYVRELAANGRSFAPGSTQKQVLTNDKNTWEGGVVEAPWVVKHDGEYFMFYSGNVYDDRYRTGVARAKSPTGPFTKKGAPILTNNAAWVGPGHGSVVHVHGKDVFFHHAWPALSNGKHDTSKGRFGLVAPITWGKDGWPSLGGSSVTKPMPWP